ncbi:MAG: alanine racemase [Alphaproteobacteria bacterium]|nr:alanine racemase [Alphaproteobacteria bacterium]
MLTTLPPTPAVASRLSLDAGALAHNLGVFREIVGPGVRVGCVVKGNAYGHGLLEVLPAVHPACDVLDVVTAQEAATIRAWEARTGAPRRDVLVIGPVDATEAVALAGLGVELVVGDPSLAGHLPALRAAGVPPLRVHVHVDSGLSREGFLPETLASELAWLREAGPVVEVVGVLTHFADTEDVTEQTWARRQLARFDEGDRALRAWLAELGRPTALTRHAAASAAALVLPESRLDLVRVGISAYGLWPSRETRISTRLVRGSLPELRPVLSWRVPSQLVKTVPAGSYVGYGCTHRCRDETRVAVLPVGYFDGYPRLLSNRAHVLVDGRRCPVLGRVMMNHVIVDVTGLRREVDHVVATLLGEDGGERVTADDLADWAQTISYELVTRLGAHLRRELVAVDASGQGTD